MYFVYLRDKNQQIYRKLATDNKEEAVKYFSEIICRKELYGRKLVAILQHKETIKEFHRFNTDAHSSQLEEIMQGIKNRSAKW